jgi:type IV secretion system T-DNA border endonuclease VirD2
MAGELPQAVTHRVINGGCKTPKRVAAQLGYLARLTGNFKVKDGEKDDSKPDPAVKLRLSARYGEEELKPQDIKKIADSWALQSGIYQPGQSEADSKKELTTHLAISFPPGTPIDAAEQAGLGWARILFHSGRFGAEWDYVTAFHTDRKHPHMHVVVNRRAFPPENSHGSAMGKWLKIAHRYEPDKERAAENGKEFGINYKILRDVAVEASAKFGIFLEATSRQERGLDSPSLTHGQYRQQQKIGAGEVKEHFGYIPESAFGDVLEGHPGYMPKREFGDVPDGNASGPSPQAQGAAGQAGGQQDGGSSSDPSVLPTTAVDKHRRDAAIDVRRMQADVENDERENEEPSRRKTPGGVIDIGPETAVEQPQRPNEGEEERTTQAQKQRELREANELASGPNRRKTPQHGVLEGLAEPGNSKAKDDDGQENVANRRGSRGKRRDHDPERIIETRAQKARREQREADQSSAVPPQGMKLRDTRARQERAQRNQQAPAERNQDGNTRPGKQRRGRGRRPTR